MECVYYVKERKMLSIPHEMSFIPNLLRIYFNHVKNNTEIHLGMDFKEYSFIKEEMCDEGYEEKTVPVSIRYFYQHLLQASYPLASASDFEICRALSGFILPQLGIL